MGHAEEILNFLDAQRCRSCGKQAVRGATICLECVSDEDFLSDVIPMTATVNPGKPLRTARKAPTPAGKLRASGS